MKMIKNSVLLFIIFLGISLEDINSQIETLRMEKTKYNYGIEGNTAPEIRFDLWVDGDGNKTEPIRLGGQDGKFKVIYCFQAWCPGCHSVGLPNLQKMTEALKDRQDISFMAIQTVFEGEEANTYDRMIEIQKEYKLAIPFGHDTGDGVNEKRSTVMKDYRTGGTPWFILIDKSGQVIFNDFHLNVDSAIKYLKELD